MSTLILDISTDDDVTYGAYINPMKKIEVDGVDYRVLSKELRGIGSHNRMLVTVEKITG